MLTSLHTKNLAEYFRGSGSFYYAIIDRQGKFAYINPLFQRQFNHLLANFYGKKVSGIFPAALGDQFRQRLEECLQQPGETRHLDLPILTANGVPQIIRWEFSAYPNDAGIIEHIQAIGFAMDEAESSLHANPSRMGVEAERYTYEHSAEGLWMFESTEPVSVTDSPEAIIEYWKKNSFLAECNDNMARMYGFEKADELRGATLDTLLDFSDPLRLEGLKNFIRNGFRSDTIETREFDRHGNTKYFLNSMTGIIENGKVKRVWGTQQDITGKRKLEEQLQQSEVFYRNLFANSLDGVLLTNERGAITFASPSITPILGYTSDEIVGTNTFDYAHPEDRAFAYNAFMDELAEEPKHKFISIRLLRKSGDWMWCIIRGHNLMQNPHVKGMVVYFYDDTLRKQTEAALIDSEQRFRYQATVLQNVTDIIVTTDMKRIVTSWNKVLENLTGISEKEAIGKPYRDVLSTAYSSFTNEQVADIVFNDGIWRGEVSFTDKNGEKIYLLHTISILYDDEGCHIGLLGIGKNITERKKAEQRLQESEQFYRRMSYYSLDGIIMSDAKGTITYCGPSVEKISGYEPAQLLGHNFFEFIHPEDIPAAGDAFT
ncbi:MAG: PAS domain S-box protein, partial [Bacteroidota bacterium]